MSSRKYYHGQTATDYKRRDRLIESIAADGNLCDRLISCGVLSQGSYGWEKKCRLPACPYCRALYARRAGRAAVTAFDAADNSELSMASVLLGGTIDVEKIGDIFLTARSDLRNRVNRQRSMLRRWDRVQIVGWLEVDAVSPLDVPLLPPERREALLAMGLPSAEDHDVIWLPSFHAVVWHPGVDWQEVRDAFALQWECARQVHVQPARSHLTPEQNIRNIVSYALKHQCQTSIGGARIDWPPSWLAEFYEWLHSWSQGFRRTRVLVGPANVSNKRHSSCSSRDNTSLAWIEPMPIT